MNVLIIISLRNLLRQKRRNALLGSAIALGMMILVVANSFSNGITDILLNKIVVRVAGHLQLAFNEKGNVNRMIFRDKERMVAAIKNNVEGIREVEEAIGVFSRVIGNGKADNLVMVGIDLSQTLSEETRKEIEESFRMLVGDFKDLAREDVENPAIVSSVKAKFLNVKKGDILRARFKNVFGADDTARFTVVGIVDNDNVFMQTVMFTELRNIKRLMGFRPHEVSNLNITIENPRKNAVKMADKLHAALKPGLAAIYGEAARGEKKSRATALGLRSDESSQKIIDAKISILGASAEVMNAGAKVSPRDRVLVSESLARKIGLGPGDDFNFTYGNKFEGKSTTVKYAVSSVFGGGGMGDKDVVLIGDRKFYDTYYENLPESAGGDAYLPSETDPMYGAFAPEWELLERTTTTDDLQKKIRDISRGKWKATTVDVRTMYESASDVLKLENVLNLITVSAVLILFVIILIGIVNTLRMAVRERTREIGTVRAIGMQRRDVRNTFILEALFLSVISSALGIALGFAVMHLLSAMSFEMKDNPMSILLVNGHLYFKPTLAGIASNIILILGIVVGTAYIPARRAANLSPSAALRHYE